MGNLRAAIGVGLLVFVGLMGSLHVWAAVQNRSHPKTFTHYVGGCWLVERWNTLKAEEAYAAGGGHQPWRQDPANLASVYAHDLLPPRFVQGDADWIGSKAVVRRPGGLAVYRNIHQRGNRARVDLYVRGKRQFELFLVRPFHYGWFITRIVPQTASARWLYRGQPGVDMVTLRTQLEKVGYGVEWKPEAGMVVVTRDKFRTQIRIGAREAVIPGNLSCRLRMINGRVYVPGDLIGQVRFRESVANYKGPPK